MRPYSQDLRERVLASIHHGEYTQAEAAEAFSVSLSAVEAWLRRERATASCAALPARGGVPRKLAGAAAHIREALARQPELSLSELCDHVKAACQISASPSMMCREVARLALPRKKSRSMPASGTRPPSKRNAASSKRK